MITIYLGGGGGSWGSFGGEKYTPQKYKIKPFTPCVCCGSNFFFGLNFSNWCEISNWFKTFKYTTHAHLFVSPHVKYFV